MIPRLLMTAVLTVGLAAAAMANESKPNASRGEGNWGIDGAAVVRVFNTEPSPRLTGSVRNITDHDIHDITVAVGNVDSNGQVEYTAVAKFPATLPPNAIWRFEEELRRVDYGKVLSVSVDGKDLTLAPGQ